MELNFLQSYIDDNKMLAKTIVIKSSIAADTINSDITLKNKSFFIDELDLTSWKYYMNISGLYHTLDEPMYVTSLDTQNEILFNKDNLVIHTATAKAYQYGTRYYYSLINKYPNQEQLILGILYPCDINKAISSKNGTILSYPDYLVESQESSLMIELEEYIIRYIERWYIPAFIITDPLYPAVFLGLLYLNIYIKLLNLRVKRCKTIEAHSFHIKEYLASHNNLDIYIPYMTLKQKLWLYRNINYLSRNNGKVEQFKILIQKLLTDRRIPISEFTVRQLGSFDDKFLPEILIRRKPVNPEVNTADKKYFPIEDLETIEKKLVYGNTDYYDRYRDEINTRLKLSTSNVLQSKDLESRMVDISNSVPVPIDNVLLYLWADLINLGMYDAIVTFKDSKTFEYVSIDAKDAFIYMQYITLSSLGVNITTIPNFVNFRSIKTPSPTLEDFLSIVDKNISGIKDTALDIKTNFPQLDFIHANSSFFNLGYEIYQESLRHWYMVSRTEDLYERAYVENMILTLFEVKMINLTNTPTDIGPWLFARNLRPYDYSYKQSEELIVNIFNAATGLVIDNTKLLKNIQSAMIAIMRTLSSYTVQYINNINDGDIVPINWAAIRLGNLSESGGDTEFIPEGIVIEEIHENSTDSVVIESVNNIDQVTDTTVETIADFEIPLTIIDNVSANEYLEVPISGLDIEVSYTGYDPVISNKSNFVGYEFFVNLTDEQKKDIVSIY